MRLMRLVETSTRNTTRAFVKRAARIFMEEYSALSERSVVNEPAPASKGKTTGT